MENCPEIKIVLECSTLESLINSNEVYHPRLLIIDTVLSGVSSFKLYGRHAKIDFKTIFTSGGTNDVISALRISASDYLLKPIKKEELIEAIQKVTHELIMANPLKITGTISL
jgi:two-component system, LytTR family, response regulator